MDNLVVPCHPHPCLPPSRVIFVTFKMKTALFINVVGLKNFEALTVASASQIKILLD